jgi:hypothetical protein
MEEEGEVMWEERNRRKAQEKEKREEWEGGWRHVTGPIYINHAA